MRRPYRMAIVGAGPSGMYALEHLLGDKDHDLEVDVFERLPVPWGLVRYGVAPDHADKKLIASRLYQNLLQRENVRFLGNIEIGKDVQTHDLFAWYDGVIFANGATSDKPLGIPGEDLQGSWSAQAFVAWYNGHPDFSHLQFNLSCKRAVVIGNGNVALDVARILCMPLEELEKTDMADHALETLRESAIEEVMIVGRRSCANAAFNNPELEEIARQDTIDIIVDDPIITNMDQAVFNQLRWEDRRKIDTLREISQRKTQAATKRIVFKFATSPVAMSGKDQVDCISLAPNETRFDDEGLERVISTGTAQDVEAGLVLRAIGYRGTPFPGLPFDTTRAVIENHEGRIMEGEKIVEGGYVTGWIKRGPQGVIGTNKKCAAQTVSALMCDLNEGRIDTSRTLDRDAVFNEIKARQSDFVTLKGWNAIDKAEKKAGLVQNRDRQKICDVDTMLTTAQNAR